MKVVFVYLKAYSQTGGIEAFNNKFIKALHDIAIDNLDVRILSLYDSNSNCENLPDKIKFEGFNGKPISLFNSLVKLVDRETMVFYGHINIAPFAIFLYLSGLNKKAHFIIHGIDVWKKFSFIKRIFFKNFKYLSVSNYTKTIFSSTNDINLSNISIFPNCIDTLTTSNLNPFDTSKFNLLTVSRLDPSEGYKGIDSLIETIPFLIERIPNFKLTIIGKGDDKNRLIKIVESLNVREYVDFKGFVETLEGYYEFCDLFSLPSSGEGFGIVYLEAMKYSKLVIAANAGGATDVIKHDVTGKLCLYGNIKCLSETILNVHDHPKKHEEIGDSGKDYLMRNFTYEKFKERLSLIISKEKSKL